MKHTLWTVATLIVALSAALSTAAEPKRHPLAHVVHITASLTFDGKPARIDDLIDCYASYTGTPTSSPHMVFRPNRIRITHEVPGGGMITFGVSRELCYVNGDQWGSALPSYTAPAEWTPVLEWYDDRDVLKRMEGRVYLSETALKNPDGRLKITEPFVVSTPEQPASNALLEQVRKQSVERDWYQGRNFTFKEILKIDRSPTDWMVHIPAEDWRDPQAARPKHKFRKWGQKRVTNFRALAEILEPITSPDLVSVGAMGSLGNAEADALKVGLLQGRSPHFPDILNFGIPKLDTDRFGLLHSPRGIETRQRSQPYYPSRYDEYIPFKCVSGVMTTVPETPGVRYWYRNRCSHPDHYKGHIFFGRKLAGPKELNEVGAIFDGRTKDLWLKRGG